MPYPDKILIEIFKDEELDVFGVYAKRKKEAEAKLKKKLQSKEFLRKTRKQNESLKNICRKLIDTYGTEGSVKYLKIIFRNDVNCVNRRRRSR